MIRRRMNPRKSIRYAGFLPIESKNPAIDSQMLAMTLRDCHVVVTAAEILSEMQARRADEAGQLATREEGGEPHDFPAPRPPPQPDGARGPTPRAGFSGGRPRGRVHGPPRDAGQ